MNIRVDLNYPIKDSPEVVFRSPVDCSQVTGLKVYYLEDGATKSQEFAFADAHGNNVGDIEHLFTENVVVKVILDVTSGMAFVQNADTNAYLEGRFTAIEEGIFTKTLTVADFSPGSIDASGNVNTSSTSFAITPELIECTEAKPIYATANGTKSTMYLYYYGENGFLGVKGGLRMVDGGNILSVFSGNRADVTHVRIAINYNNNKTPITDKNLLKTAVGEFTFTQKYFDPFVRHSEIQPKKLKVIALGDSITKAEGTEGWTTYFLEKINGEMIANVAVGGAVLADSATASQPKWLSSQVDAIVDGTYEAPDVIMIAVGTNEGIFIKETVTTEGDETVTEGAVKNRYSSIRDAYYNGTELIALENVDRTTDAGAFRYATDKLHAKYPDAVIFWCSPVHRARGDGDTKKAETVRAWNESLRIATEYTGQRHIDTIHCGINSANEVYKGEGECLTDGLHPNARGAKMIGYYNAAKVNATIFEKRDEIWLSKSH